MWRKYYILKAAIFGEIPVFLMRLQEKNELFLSANVRLSGIDKVAYIESSSLAEKFKEACMQRLQKRYGAEFQLDVVECEGLETNKYIARKIVQDSEIITKRLATGNFASNKPV